MHQVCVNLPDPGAHGGDVVQQSSDSDNEDACAWLNTADDGACWLRQP